MKKKQTNKKKNISTEVCPSKDKLESLFSAYFRILENENLSNPHGIRGERSFLASVVISRNVSEEPA